MNVNNKDFIRHMQNINEYINNEVNFSDFKDKFDPRDLPGVNGIMIVFSFVIFEEIYLVKDNPFFLNVYDLVEKSKANGTIDKKLVDIYQQNYTSIDSIFSNKLNEIKKIILKDQYSNYLNLIKKGSEDIAKKIFNKCLSKVDDKVLDDFNVIDRDYLRYKNKSFVLELIPNLPLYVMDDDKETILKLAYLICFPYQQFMSSVIFDDGWKTFPLKWKKDLQIPIIKQLLFQHNQGEDLTSVFEENYNNNEFSVLNNLLESNFLLPPVNHMLCSRKEIIHEIIKNYKNGSYASALYASLPQIESPVLNLYGPCLQSIDP